jgi:hypothetical protein
LNKSFISALILPHLDQEREIVVKPDASNLVVTGVLSHYDDDNILYPMSYFSRKHSPAKINHETYDKKHLAILWAFKE